MQLEQGHVDGCSPEFPVTIAEVAVIDLPSSVSNVHVADTTGALHEVGTATVMNKGIATSPIGVDLSSGGIINAGSRLSVDMQSQFTVLALRQAEALQRWKEISQSGDSDYREQIRKHFGVNLPQALSNMCTYIGGISRNQTD